jgi:hypothetical protein
LGDKVFQRYYFQFAKTFISTTIQFNNVIRKITDYAIWNLYTYDPIVENLDKTFAQTIEEHDTSHDATTTSNLNIAPTSINLCKWCLLNFLRLILQDHKNSFVLKVSHMKQVLTTKLEMPLWIMKEFSKSTKKIFVAIAKFFYYPNGKTCKGPR